MVLLHMMREGEAALDSRDGGRRQRGDLRLLRMFAEDLESSDGGLLEQNAQQFDGLYNSIECRETWSAVDRAARRKQIEASGLYGLNARLSKSPAFCPVWRVPPAPAAERQPVKSEVPTLLLSGGYDWLTPPAWGREAAKTSVGVAPRRVPRPRATAWSSRIPAPAACATVSSTIPTPSGRCPAAPTRRPISPPPTSARASLP